jgi:hypothetical protein
VSVVPGTIVFVPGAITYWEAHVGVGIGVGVGDAGALGVHGGAATSTTFRWDQLGSVAAGSTPSALKLLSRTATDFPLGLEFVDPESRGTAVTRSIVPNIVNRTQGEVQPTRVTRVLIRSGNWGLRNGNSKESFFLL